MLWDDYTLAEKYAVVCDERDCWNKAHDGVEADNKALREVLRGLVDQIPNLPHCEIEFLERPNGWWNDLFVDEEVMGLLRSAYKALGKPVSGAKKRKRDLRGAGLCLAVSGAGRDGEGN